MFQLNALRIIAAESSIHVTTLQLSNQKYSLLYFSETDRSITLNCLLREIEIVCFKISESFFGRLLVSMLYLDIINITFTQGLILQ